MNGRFIKKAVPAALILSMMAGVTGCGNKTKETDSNKVNSGEKIVIRVLENDTAKKTGYLDELLKSFNAEFKDKGIEAVDANMEEYTDLATNGPYGYGPDIIFQANDRIMTYAEDKHILPIEIEKLDCYSQIPESAWEAYNITIDGKTYCCGVPVNIQEPMLFYRADMLPENWESEWDDNKNGTPDFFENWNDLYAYSKLLRDTDTSSTKSEQYGFMQSLYDPYLASQFYLSYGAYVFGKNEDGTYNPADIGFSANDAANGLMAMKQFAGLMYEGCIDNTITLNRYEKIANGTYFCTVSTPDTYSLFVEKLALTYEEGGDSQAAAKEKAEKNLMMIELPSRMPKDGVLSKDASEMSDDDFVSTVVMGGVNGYAISSYTKYKDACMEFVNFATSYDMIKNRMNMLGIAPAREDVAKESGGITDMIFTSLREGRIYLMPSIKAVDRIWVPAQTIFSSVAKDAFSALTGTETYVTKDDFKKAMETIDKNIYDAIFTLAD